MTLAVIPSRAVFLVVCNLRKKDSKMKLKLKQKITLITVLLCALPLLILGVITTFIATNKATTALQHSAEEQLISLRNVKKTEIEHYFKTIENQAANLAKSERVVAALDNLTKAIKQLSQQDQQGQTDIKQQLATYYDSNFISQYRDKNPDATVPSTSQLLDQLDYSALKLQAQFIAKNSNDNSEYSYWHSQYHPYFDDFTKRFGFYDLFLVDADSGRVVYTTFKEVDFATSLKNGPYASSGLAQAYQKGMQSQTGEFAVVDFEPYLPSYELPAGFIATPIVKNGVKTGVLIIQLPVDNINQIMTFDNKWQEAGLGESGETYLVGGDKLVRSESRFLIEDKSNFIQVLTDSNNFNNNVINTIKASGKALGVLPVDSKAIELALQGNSGFETFDDYRGESVFSAYAPVEVQGLDWAILAERDEQEALKSAQELGNSLLKSGLLLMLGMTILASAIAFKFADVIAKPIIQISDFVKDVAKSFDLTARFKLKRDDEIGDMANAFNGLLETFHKSINDVSDASNQIAAASEETSAITEQSSRVLQIQQTETEQVSTSMNEMTTTVNEVAKNTTNTYSLADSANDQVQVGTKAMNKTIEDIQNVAEILTETSETVANLEQSSNHISSVLDVINNIAEQTNLLALNAAIEAARAGEHGRGFAVVADEVRGLASRTQDSISEITKVINELQDGSKQAVESMNQSKERVENTVNQAQTTGEALTSISDSMQNINDMTRQIATAAEQQGAVAEEINRNIVRINDTGVETAQGATETSQASQELARLASDLNNLVAKFKV